MPESKSYPVLPKLTRDIFTTPGKWQKSGPEVVKDIADGLEVPDRFYDLKSIPDVWARPLLFESALYATNQPTRTRIVQGEWRGLLAVLALRRMRGLGNLTFEPVFQGEHGSFIEVAKRLLPDVLVDSGAPAQWQNSSIHAETKWSHVSTILLDGKAIGMTCPTTLVVTAADYADKLDPRLIPWFQNGLLQDPHPFLSAEEKGDLANWLHTVHQELISARAEGPKWLRLSPALRSYIRDLAVGEPSVLKISRDVVVVGTAFSSLGTPLPLRPEKPGESDVELIPDPARAHLQNRRALVLDEDTARQWKRRLTEIRVRRALPLDAALRGRDERRRDTVGGVPLQNADWYEAKDFFTDFVAVFPDKTGSRAFPGTKSLTGQANLRVGGQPVSVIVPVRSKWLAWLTADSLASRVTLLSEGDSIKVSLRLPLKGGDLTIHRSYSPAEIKECAATKVPTCKIWPFIGANTWKAFYTYYDNSSDLDMVMLTPHTDKPAEFSRRINVPGSPKDHIAMVWRTSSLPEAVVATFGDKDAGILLLETPVKAPTGKDEWTIGIDFGTTGTTIFYRLPTEKMGRPLPLQSRLLNVTDEPPALKRNTYDRFLPTKEQGFGAILSIYHDFEIAKPESSNVIQPLTEGHIAYLQYAGHFSAWAPGIKTNMKWGGVRERALGHAFLHQLGLQICAEAVAAGVGTISWRFSFPTAFSEHRYDEFRGIWASVVERSNNASGIVWKVQDGSPSQKFLYKNESVATAHFFFNTETASLRAGAVCIDIGGGTTDIAVWQNNRVISQTSFRFAGRNLFLHPLYERPSVLESFGCNITGLLEAKARGELPFHNQVDVLLKTPGKEYPDTATEMLHKLPILMGDEVVSRFVDLLRMGIAGIFHYVGLMVRDLEARSLYNRLLPNIYIGGNGSKILHWCSGGSFEPTLDTDRKLKAVFARATGFNDLGKQSFQITMSPAPKSEVAHGLVVNAKELKENDKFDPFVEVTKDPPLLVGEGFSIGEKKEDWNLCITKTFDLSSAEIDPELPQLSAFLKAFGTDADAETLRRYASIAGERLSKFIIHDSASEEEQETEPVFITVLKAMYDEEIKRWVALPQAQRQKSAAQG